MEKIVIKGRRREEKGTRAARALRAQGLVPVVLYGREDGKTLHLSLEAKAVEKMLRGHARVVEVDLDDGTKESGLVKDVQFDPVTDQVLHMDLFHVDLTKPVEVEVPLEFVGHPKGISEGGKFTHDLADLPLICLPTEIPQVIKVKVSHLGVGDHITAGDLEIPENVKLGVPPETVVCHVKAFLATAEAHEEEAEAGPSEPEVIGKKDEEEGES